MPTIARWRRSTASSPLSRPAVADAAPINAPLGAEFGSVRIVGLAGVGGAAGGEGREGGGKRGEFELDTSLHWLLVAGNVQANPEDVPGKVGRRADVSNVNGRMRR